MSRMHTVRSGESLLSIARKYGLSDWREIYNHPANADFRRKRPNPNLILPGDVVLVPDPDPGWAEKITNTRLDEDSLGCLRERFTLTLKEVVSTAIAAGPAGASALRGAITRFAQAAGLRLWQLAKKTARAATGSQADRLGHQNHFDPLYLMRAEIRAKGGLPKINQNRISSYTSADPVKQLYLELEQEFERAARGMLDVAFDRDDSGNPVPPPDIRIILTGFDPFGSSAPTSEVWNPSGAAMLALDGWRDTAAGCTLGVETMIFPVSFTQFEGGAAPQYVQPSIVEWALRPHLASVHAIITVSQGAAFQVEPCAVGVQDNSGSGWDHVHTSAAKEGPTPSSRVPASKNPKGALGSLIYQEPRAEELGKLAVISSGGIAVSNETKLEFPSDTACQNAYNALLTLGLSSSDLSQTAKTLSLMTFKAVAKVLSSASNNQTTTSTSLSFTAGGSTYTATVREGPGGNFLSNQVSYRTRRLLKEQNKEQGIITFHVHTRPYNTYTTPDDVINKLKLIVKTLAGKYPP